MKRKEGNDRIIPLQWRRRRRRRRRRRAAVPKKQVKKRGRDIAQGLDEGEGGTGCLDVSFRFPPFSAAHFFCRRGSIQMKGGRRRRERGARIHQSCVIAAAETATLKGGEERKRVISDVRMDGRRDHSCCCLPIAPLSPLYFDNISSSVLDTTLLLKKLHVLFCTYLQLFSLCFGYRRYFSPLALP